LLRHAGSHEGCTEICQIKAIASMTGAFELPATIASLKDPFFGAYDYYILRKLKKIFSEK